MLQQIFAQSLGFERVELSRRQVARCRIKAGLEIRYLDGGCCLCIQKATRIQPGQRCERRPGLRQRAPKGLRNHAKTGKILKADGRVAGGIQAAEIAFGRLYASPLD